MPMSEMRCRGIECFLISVVHLRLGFKHRHFAACFFGSATGSSGLRKRQTLLCRFGFVWKAKRSKWRYHDFFTNGCRAPPRMVGFPSGFPLTPQTGGTLKKDTPTCDTLFNGASESLRSPAPIYASGRPGITLVVFQGCFPWLYLTWRWDQYPGQTPDLHIR